MRLAAVFLTGGLGAGLILAACAHRPSGPPIEPASSGAPPAAGPATAPDAGVASAELEGLPAEPVAAPATDAAGTVSDAGVPGIATAEAAPDGGPLEPPLPLSYPVPIDDPGGQALAPLYAALARAEHGEGQARLLFYGASHTASDLYTDLMRRRLQQRFGEAGPGFVMPAKPWRWYRHGGFAYERSRNWTPVRVLAAAPRPDSYGLAGVALDAGGERFAVAAMTAQAHAELNGQVSRFELYYQLQPDGGRLAVFVDGQRVRSLSTAALHTQAAYAEFLVEDGVHRFELRSQGDGPVRVFGVAAERAVPGVVVDTLGIPGSRAAYQLQWNDPLYREHLARRSPDLVALAYGTNEAGDDDVPIESYSASLRAVLVRIREVVPNAACLLIGPTDRPLKLDDGTFTVRPRVEAINAVQRSLAQEHGCAFFDTLAFMGGPLAMTRWVAAVPPLGAPDHVHFTRRGYELMAEALLSALLSGYPPPPPPVAALSAPGASRTPAAAPCSTACR